MLQHRRQVFDRPAFRSPFREAAVEDEDLFGSAVQMAARVRDVTEPNQILITRIVHQLAEGDGFVFKDKGPATLRGFEEPIPLFSVEWA